MFKFITTAVIVTLLSACSSMSGGSMASSSGRSGTSTMGAMPSGGMSGGPN